MLGNIISAVGNIAGGILGSREKDKDRELQKDFAQQGIQWKVEDAKKAGIHPLAALGAQTMAYSPVSVGGSDLSTGLAGAGQDIARAVNATRSTGDRVDAYSKTIQDLNISRMGLENQLLASQIAKINQAGTPPALPKATDAYLLEGQGNSPLVTDSALERISGSPFAPSQEGGAITDVGFSRTKTGYHPVMSKDVKDRLEEDWLGTVLWNMRNRIEPTVGPTTNSQNPPPIPAPEGKVWAYNPLTQEYQLYSRWPRKGNYYVYY